MHPFFIGASLGNIVAEVSLPPPQQSASHRIRRTHRTFCWGWSPTEFTDLHRTSCCVYSPTELTEFTESANFRGCTCLKCTNVTRGISILLGWCTSCSVGALLALASGKAERRQVYPLEGTQTICVDLCNLWENILSKKFCEFCAVCGRTSSARSSVNSVTSVGEYTQSNNPCCQ